ncbi:MAG: hypothetical protein EOO89_09390 [Pedobacter sp.]|nr:MAG: hypothetical protein EOO89_09390 [Pedobacter sp.]
MKSQEEIIIGAIVHIVNAIAARMMETAFGLAYEGELADMKAYRAPKEYTKKGAETELFCIDLEIELLDSLADDGVKTIVASMKLLYEFKRVYLLINNLDLIDILLDDECAELSHKIYGETPLDPTLNYKQQKEEENANYFWYNLSIWRCIKMILYKRINFDNDQDQFMKEYFDFCLNDTTSENKNAALLYDLQRTLELGMIGRDSW